MWPTSTTVGCLSTSTTASRLPTPVPLEAALAEWPNAELQDQAEFKEGITEEIDQMLNLIYGLLALAVVIALIGIAIPSPSRSTSGLVSWAMPRSACTAAS